MLFNQFKCMYLIQLNKRMTCNYLVSGHYIDSYRTAPFIAGFR